MAQTRAFDVAVVGTGVAGLATALGCAQSGLRVALIGPPPRVFEPTAAQPFDLRIYALAPACAEFLSRLKVWQQVRAQRVQSVARMRVFGDGGHELNFDAWSAHRERLATIVEEAELLRVLAAACAYAPGIVHHEAQFESQRLDGANAVVGQDNGAELGCGLVIGADGAHSAVRAAAGIGAREVPYGSSGVVANFACAGPHDETAFQWFCDEGVVALLPLPEQRVSLVWSAPQALADELVALAPAALAARVTQRTAAAVGELTPLGAAHAFALRKLTVDRTVAERVALVGDAAHVVHPLAGQGLNLGLLDVSELLRALSEREPMRDVGDPVVLRRYARRRAEPVALMRTTTDALAHLFAFDEPRVRQARNVGMSVLDRLAPVKRALVRHALG